MCQWRGDLQVKLLLPGSHRSALASLGNECKLWVAVEAEWTMEIKRVLRET